MVPRNGLKGCFNQYNDTFRAVDGPGRKSRASGRVGSGRVGSGRLESTGPDPTDDIQKSS